MLKRLEWLYRFLASKEAALGLFGFFCIILIPKAFIKEESDYLNIILNVVLGLIGLSLLLCTLQRLKTLSMPVLIIHVGAILTLAGSVISFSGFIATVNIYEGSAVDKAYRWDIKKEIPLGVELTVEKINMEYYPIPVKVGVLIGEKKAGLFMLKTGESFNLEGYAVRVDSLELPSENLKLSVFNQGHYIGSADTTGENNLPSDFPYEFRLVAYKTPFVKRAWLDLRLTKDSEIISEGISEANSPFKWKGLNFYHMQIDRDQYGIAFAGLQISKDPGRPFVFFGFAIVSFGVLLYLVRRFYGRR